MLKAEEARRMCPYWNLFCATGDPVFYLLYKEQAQESRCAFGAAKKSLKSM